MRPGSLLEWIAECAVIRGRDFHSLRKQDGAILGLVV